MPLQSHCMVQYDDVTSYLIGGYNVITKEPKNFLFKFDWKTQTWTQKASMIEEEPWALNQGRRLENCLQFSQKVF
jgi:hypothetical protein